MFKDFLQHLKHGFDFGMAYLGKFEQSMFAGCGDKKIGRMDKGIQHQWGLPKREDSRDIPFTQKADYLSFAEKQALYRKAR